MFTITKWFYCVDHLSIKHEVVRTFTGKTREDVAIEIARFSRNLEDCGWVIVKSMVQKNLAKLPER